MSLQPIILLTFSNDQDAYLSSIAAEQKAIKQALLDYVDQNYLQIRDVQRVSTEEVFYLVNRYHNRIQILHYAGHADGQMLQLEKEIGIVQTANAKGVAGLLGTQTSLKLVFLNGCATRGQVKALLDQGVPAVIATSVKIEDNTAQEFATQFYSALGSGSSLREAFQKAKAFVETQGQAPAINAIEATRGIALEEVDNSSSFNWGLYWKAEQAEVLDWKIAKESALQVDFRTDAIDNTDRARLNNHLVDHTLKAIRDSEFVKDLARKINKERQAGDANRRPTDAEKKDVIIRSFPAPISVHLRSLFSERLGNKADRNHLTQLLTVYQNTVKLTAIILLSDLWDACSQQANKLERSAAEERQLRSFFDLNALSATTFDYFLLGDALLTLAARNQLSFFLEPLQVYQQGWLANTELAAVHDHFQHMQAALEGDIPSQHIEAYCLQSEQKLTQLLSSWHFLVHYKMAVVKNIEVQQIKNLPPTRYRHVMVELANNYNDIGQLDRKQYLDESTDMESVLMYKEQINENLNLSPFVLDENALLRADNYKVYLFSHSSQSNLCYHWIENEEDKLEIDEEQFAYIRKQFNKARQELLGEQIVETQTSTQAGEDDILSLL